MTKKRINDIFQLVIVFSFSFQLMQASSSSGNETDQLALLKFKAGIISDPHGIFNSWNDSVPFCQWYGITCSARHPQRVTSIVLRGQNLIGSISPYIGNLSFLGNLNIRNNSFNGQIPQEIGSLFRLRQFFVNNNTFRGEIPVNMTRCTQLKLIDMSWNNLAGKIPAELGSLAMLEILQISANRLTGKIPPALGNLSLLTLFSAIRNNLEGSIPDDLSRLRSLTYFSLAENKLSGTIPPDLFNISSIKIIGTTQNKLEGSLPDDIGLTLPNIQRIALGENMFSGSIPSSLCNASQLESLDVTRNQFVGQVPICLGNLQSLSRLNVGVNNLGTNSSTDLAFLTPLNNCSSLKYLVFNANNLGGVLPNSMGNLSVQLIQLLFGINQITGIIPEALENFVNLIALDMGHNLFHGAIPSSLGNLQNLRILVLEDNRFSGQIPSSIGNLTRLFQVSLAQNNLEGTIPANIGDSENLQYLDVSENNLNGSIPSQIFHSSFSMLLNLSHNSLTGNLSSDVGKLINLNKLDISINNLSGEIPGTIGACLSLEYLYMQENSFQGTIPSLASLKGLQQLDLSRNHLTGEIPKDLQSLGHNLLFLNLSFNNLEDEIPTGGVFSNVSAFSVIGNSKLCGGVPELHQPKCHSNKGKSTGFLLAITIPCVIVVCVLFTLAFVLVNRRRESRKSSSAAEPEEMGGLVIVSYRDLYNATGGFSTDSLVGSGGFGSVYKGYLNQMERLVAIKVLKLDATGASKSFMAECKVLRTVRHQNLVKLLTYCSSIDNKHNEFKALVFEFMAKGSLEKWIHHHDIDNNNKSISLKFLQRLNIAIDVASALHYLHDLYGSPIIHCDLKPSNVLLDDNMVAHLSDFGLARLYLTANDASLSETSSIGIRGTVGYAPPEYGMGAVASKEGDVYSYGILVLELFTGKRPTDRAFEDNLNLHNFVQNALPEGLEQIMDPALLRRGKKETTVAIAEEDDDDEEEEEGSLLSCDIDTKEETSSHGNLHRMQAMEKGCLLSVFKVGVACSAESPQERTTMGDVAKELRLIKSTFLGVPYGAIG